MAVGLSPKDGQPIFGFPIVNRDYLSREGGREKNQGRAVVRKRQCAHGEI